MRKITALLIAGLALGLPAAASAQTGDNVSGWGVTELGSTFAFGVDGTASGASPTGHFSLTGPPSAYAWEASPRCMNAAGDRATVGFFIESGSIGGVDISGQGVQLWVQDVAGSGIAYYRTLGPDVPGDPQPITCPDPRDLPGPAFDDIGVTGYISVNDRQPPIPPGTDSVAGSGSDCLSFLFDGSCGQQLLFDAGFVSDPDGRNPRGAAHWHDAGPTPGASSTWDTAATCLSVRGRVAVVGVTGSRHRYGASEAVFPLAGLIRIVDGGGPGSGADTFQFAFQTGTKGGPPLPGPTSCSAFPGPFPVGNSPFPGFTNEVGDVVVTDSQVLPTSKEQCKKDGWRAFGVFRNQGDCVSFVATHGRK